MKLSDLINFRKEHQQKWEDFVDGVVDLVYLSWFGFCLFTLIIIAALAVNVAYGEPKTGYVYFGLLAVHFLAGGAKLVWGRLPEYVGYSEAMNLFFLLALMFNLNYNFFELNREVSALNITILSAITITLSFSNSKVFMFLKITAIIGASSFFIEALPDALKGEWYVSLTFGTFLGAIFNVFLRQSLGLMFYLRETESKAKLHSYKQMKQMVYPHQLEMMKASYDLIETMPLGSGQASVITFDIQASSKHPTKIINEVLERIIFALEEENSKSYTHNPLSARFFPIKEMGDGLILSVGYPFASKTYNHASEAFSLCLDILKIFQETTRKLDVELYCSMAIADGEVTSYFSQVAIKNYDCYGRPIILSSRYESFRKILLSDLGIDANIIIVRYSAYHMLSLTEKRMLQRYKLSQKNCVRDDIDAEYLYYFCSDRVKAESDKDQNAS